MTFMYHTAPTCSGSEREAPRCPTAKSRRKTCAGTGTLVKYLPITRILPPSALIFHKSGLTRTSRLPDLIARVDKGPCPLIRALLVPNILLRESFYPTRLYESGRLLSDLKRSPPWVPELRCSLDPGTLVEPPRGAIYTHRA